MDDADPYDPIPRKQNSKLSELIPPPSIAWAILFGLLLLPLFALLGRIASAPREPGPRLRVAFGLACVLWIAVSVATNGSQNSAEVFAVDLVAGVAVLLCAAIGAHQVISLFAWGFTVRMLLDIDRADTALTMDQWLTIYGEGAGFENFILNRLSLLKYLGVARQVDTDLVLTPRGRLIAWVARVSMAYFGVGRADALNDGGAHPTPLKPKS